MFLLTNIFEIINMISYFMTLLEYLFHDDLDNIYVVFRSNEYVCLVVYDSSNHEPQIVRG